LGLESNVRFIVLPRFRGHTIIVVEIQQEVFMTKGKNYQRYPAEFKRMALLKASEDGVTANSVCEDLGISFRQLSRWRDEFRLKGDSAFTSNKQTRNDELLKLKKELEKVKKERDFLKDAVVFFAKESD